MSSDVPSLSHIIKGSAKAGCRHIMPSLLQGRAGAGSDGAPPQQQQGGLQPMHAHAGAPGGVGFPNSAGGSGPGDSNDANRWEKAAVPCIEHLTMLGLQPLSASYCFKQSDQQSADLPG